MQIEGWLDQILIKYLKVIYICTIEGEDEY